MRTVRSFGDTSKDKRVKILLSKNASCSLSDEQVVEVVKQSLRNNLCRGVMVGWEDL